MEKEQYTDEEKLNYYRVRRNSLFAEMAAMSTEPSDTYWNKLEYAIKRHRQLSVKVNSAVQSDLKPVQDWASDLQLELDKVKGRDEPS